jgi:isoleucyl-tRNA synthetase
MAPILSFTAEEAWAVLNPEGNDSVFFHTWSDVLPAQAGEAELLVRWKKIREVRALVQKELETLRQASRIGSSLQAEVALRLPAAEAALFESLGDDLKFVLITSSASVAAGSDPHIEATPSAHAKCERCWHYRADVGADAQHPAICGRCVSNLYGAGEARRYA